MISDQIKGQTAVAGTDVYGASGNDVIWFIYNEWFCRYGSQNLLLITELAINFRPVAN